MSIENPTKESTLTLSEQLKAQGKNTLEKRQKIKDDLRDLFNRYETSEKRTEAI